MQQSVSVTAVAAEHPAAENPMKLGLGTDWARTLISFLSHSQRGRLSGVESAEKAIYREKVYPAKLTARVICNVIDIVGN